MFGKLFADPNIRQAIIGGVMKAAKKGFPPFDGGVVNPQPPASTQPSVTLGNAQAEQNFSVPATASPGLLSTPTLQQPQQPQQGAVPVKKTATPYNFVGK